MIAAVIVLAALATGMSLVGWIESNGSHRDRPGETKKARRKSLISSPAGPTLSSAKTTTWARVPGTPDIFEPRCVSRGEFGTSTSSAEKAVTAGALYRVRNNVPRLADRVNAPRRAFGVGRRTGVGTHRASRVPIRKAQPVRRRGVASGRLPHL